MTSFASPLPFLTEPDDDRPCLKDDDRDDWITYGALKRRAADYAGAMAGRRGLVFLSARNDFASVAALIGAIAASHAVALLDPELSAELREALIARYRPEYLIDSDRMIEPVRLSGAGADQSGDVHHDLAILLSTSGSTGSPKFVRLPLSALLSNARAIASVLEIAPDDVAAAHLPLHYSFGLSVLTSHLVMGARNPADAQRFHRSRLLGGDERSEDHPSPRRAVPLPDDAEAALPASESAGPQEPRPGGRVSGHRRATGRA